MYIMHVYKIYFIKIFMFEISKFLEDNMFEWTTVTYVFWYRGAIQNL